MGRVSISTALAAALMTMAGGMAAAQQAPVVVPGAGAAVTQAEEALLWALAEQRNTADAYRSYLQSYPNGTNAALARARLGQLMSGSTPVVDAQPSAQPVVTAPVDTAPGASPAAAAAAEAAAGTPAATQPAPSAGSATSAAQEPPLTREARRAVQMRLTQLGYDTRGVDGVFGSGTRRAISAWQSARGYGATGFLTPAQAEELRSAAPSGGTTTPAASAAATESALGMTAGDRRAVQARLTQLGYDTRGVDGTFGSGTRRAISAWQTVNNAPATGFLTRAQWQTLAQGATAPVVTPPTDSAAQAELALNLTRADRMAVQRALTAAGHDTRGVDGVFGSGTRRAIAAWQAARGVAGTGYLTASQLETLKGGGVPVVTPSGGATAADEAGLNLGPVERTEVQSRLSALGYNPRGIDGRFGPGTRAAIRAWQGDNGLAATGYLNAAQLQRLRGQRRG